MVLFNYQPLMVGTIHKWLGCNELHGNTALFSFSWLLNAKAGSDGLYFPDGAKFFISFFDDHYMKQVIRTILCEPEMFNGMSVIDVTIQEEPDFSNQTLFRCASPIFLKNSPDRNDGKHYTFEDEESGKLLTDKLLYKMDIAGLHRDESLSIRFDTTYQARRTKVIHYKKIGNRASLCPVIIEGKRDTKAFAWNVGLGNSTGIGFGAIY
jgi:CRISPR-associated endoribonuclease Cas6